MRVLVALGIAVTIVTAPEHLEEELLLRAEVMEQAGLTQTASRAISRTDVRS